MQRAHTAPSRIFSPTPKSKTSRHPNVDIYIICTACSKYTSPNATNAKIAPPLNCVESSVFSLDDEEEDEDEDEEDELPLDDEDDESPPLEDPELVLDPVDAGAVALAVEEAVPVAAELVMAAQVAYSLLSAFFIVTSNGPYNSPFCVWSLN